GGGMGEAFGCIWPICIAACLLMMVPMLVGSQVPFVLTGIGVTVATTQAFVIAMTTVMSAISGTLFGRVQATLGVTYTFAISLLLAALGLAFIGFAPSAVVAGIGCALIGIAIGLYIPHLWVLATTLVPEPIRGHAIGLLTTSMFLGGFLYAFLFGGVQRAFGLGGGLVAVAVLLALAAIGVTIGRRSRLSGGAVA
ncbi:MAG: MFS transporter, partial [Janthinobacterium lividum]